MDAWVKPPFYQSAKYLNDVNDSTLGGTLTSAPSGIGSQAQQNVPGDRIILDDATALALSDTAVGTLYGGIYCYVATLSSATASPAVGSIAFYRAADIGTQYLATSDAQPATTTPYYIYGVFINALTKGNYGWIQVMGMASVLFDSTVTSTVAATGLVIAKASASVASTADNTTTTTYAVGLINGYIGIALGTTATSTVAKVAILRGLARI